MSNAPSGSAKLSVKNSIKLPSEILPASLNHGRLSDTAPCDSEYPTPTTKASTPTIIVAFFLVILNSSDAYATTPSIIEIALVNAAKNRRTKNNSPNISPKGISANTAGSAINANPAPIPISVPVAATAGIIASAARSAIVVSITQIDAVLLTKFSLFLRYEPYVTIILIPRDSEKNA